MPCVARQRRGRQEERSDGPGDKKRGHCLMSHWANPITGASAGLSLVMGDSHMSSDWLMLGLRSSLLVPGVIVWTRGDIVPGYR